MESIAERLRYLIDTIGLTINQLNRDMGKSKSYVTNILNGTNKKPGNDFFDYMEARYNVNPFWLKLSEGEPFLCGGKKDDFRVGLFARKVNSLPEKQRDAIMTLLDDVIARYEMEELKTKV